MDKTPNTTPFANQAQSGLGSRPVQLALAFLLGAGVVILCARVLPRGAKPTERETIVVIAAVDLNQAEKSELMQLPGVGATTADKIVTVRNERGGFRDVNELRAVKGIGPARLEALRPWLHVNADVPQTAPRNSNNATERASRSSGAKKELPSGTIIDVNRAPSADLQKLPGIGPVLAQRIIAEREKAFFRSVDELRRVGGIGPKTLEKLRPHVSAGASRGVDEVAATPR